MTSIKETRCMNPQKPKTKLKIGFRKKYKEIFRMNCLIGYSRENLVDESTSERLRRDLMLFQFVSWTSHGAASIRGTRFG